MRLLGIDWAPFFVPLERRLQTLAVFHYIFCFLVAPIFCLAIPIYLLFWTQYWWTLLLYLTWFIYDKDTPKRGSRANSFFKSKTLWKPFADYFPIKLEKTADLDPNRNYIFGSHPHGIVSCAAFANFCTEATSFSKLFPGITCHLCTLTGQFWYPLRREYALSSGAIESSKEAIAYTLTQKKAGEAVVIVIGGGMEIVHAHPGSLDLILEKRRGFVKLALKCGADLVPTYSFGENDLFIQVDSPEQSYLRKFQVFLKRYCGFSPPFFHGRGIFNYSFGILPFRKPVTTIVGKPICVKQTDNPSEKEITDLHQKYMDGLVDLFEQNKIRFGFSPDESLIFH